MWPSVSRILFLSHEKLVIKFKMSLRYSLVLEVLPTQFLVASTATVNILYAFYCNKNQFHGRSIPEGYFQRHLQTSFYSSIVKITFFETTLWLGQFFKVGNIKQQGMNFPGKISNKHGHLRFVKGALKYCVAYKTY